MNVFDMVSSLQLAGNEKEDGNLSFREKFLNVFTNLDEETEKRSFSVKKTLGNTARVLVPAIVILLLFGSWSLGPAAILFGYLILIGELKKFNKFLNVRFSTENIKHSPFKMIFSLIKFLAVLYLFTTVTRGILIYPMILIWAVTFVIFTAYVKLWKYHKYSVLLLILASAGVIVLSMVTSPLLLKFIGM